MYAIIKAGAKQLKVMENDLITIDQIPGKEGDKVEFEKVLLVKGKEVKTGTPFVDSAKVTGVIVSHKRGKKILIGKHKRRKNHQKINGFRASLTEVKIEKIKG